MQYFLSKNFLKQFKKLPTTIKNRAIERLNIFVVDPADSKLNNHSLAGHWSGHRSINITGDIRAVYKMESRDTAKFVAVGSHTELYR